MSSFDANAYLKAIERPTFTALPRRAGGRTPTFEGGFLSIEQWARLQERVALLQEGALPPQQITRLIGDMTDGLFGRPPWWAPWRPCASVEMARLPLPAQLEALRTFSLSQAKAMGMTPATTDAPPAAPTTETASAPSSPGPTSSAASSASTAATSTTTPNAGPPATG